MEKLRKRRSKIKKFIKSFELKANFENHIDWVNDIQIDKKRNLMISCSNDKTIKLWKIPDLSSKDSPNGFESYYSTMSLNKMHGDYIKAIAYSEKSGNLFSASLDGRILMTNLESLLKYPNDLNSFQDFQSFGLNNSSVFAVDCDLSGDLMIASVYENVKIKKINK